MYLPTPHVAGFVTFVMLFDPDVVSPIDLSRYVPSRNVYIVKLPVARLLGQSTKFTVDPTMLVTRPMETIGDETVRVSGPSLIVVGVRVQ
jgi:hypothetical protein